MEHIDTCIIGAGVVGLAIAERIASPKGNVFVFERHDAFGRETSSRNSEVIHAGIYYPKNSLKARLCVEGKARLYSFLTEHNIAYNRCGKLIVASDENEIPYLEELFRQAHENGVIDVRMVDAHELYKREPYVKGIAALYSPSTGIFDTHAFMEKLERKAKAKGADFLYQTEILTIKRKNNVFLLQARSGDGEKITFTARVVINAAGLNADRMAAAVGIDVEEAQYALHYCKGEYFRFIPEKARLVKGLVYPVPDAYSLGMHLTPDLSGGLRIGPNAEYIDRDHYTLTVSDEKKEAFFSDAQKLLPGLTQDDIFPDTSGIRPKLQAEGQGVKDYLIKEETERGLPGFINLIGIESPGLTSSLAIAEYLATENAEVLT